MDIETIQQTILSSGIAGKIGIGIAIFLLTMLVSMSASRMLRRVLTIENSIVPASSIFITIVRVAIWACGICVIFSVCFGIDLTAIVAALGVGGLAVSLGCQDTISSLIAGIQISISKNIVPGDLVEIDSKRGFVQDVSLRYTSIETLSGEELIVPNSVINSKALLKIPEPTQIKLQFNVIDITADLDAISKDIVKNVKLSVKEIDKTAKEPYILYTAYTEFAVQGTLIFYIADEKDYFPACDSALRVISKSINRCTHARETK